MPTLNLDALTAEQRQRVVDAVISGVRGIDLSTVNLDELAAALAERHVAQAAPENPLALPRLYKVYRGPQPLSQRRLAHALAVLYAV